MVSSATTTAWAAEVSRCLADAGYPTTLADVSTFAGGIAFFPIPDQAAARAHELSDASKELRLSGSALIHVSAGTGYEAHVDAAEECFTQSGDAPST